MTPQIPDKTFFKIGEVSNILGVKPHIVRYWESEFRQIRLTKTKSGQRLFRRRDIELLLAIRVLLHEQQFTVAGAKTRLKELLDAGVKTPDLLAVVQEIAAPTDEQLAAVIGGAAPSNDSSTERKQPDVARRAQAPDDAKQAKTTPSLIMAPKRAQSARPEQREQLRLEGIEDVPPHIAALSENEKIQDGDKQLRVLALEKEIAALLQGRASLLGEFNALLQETEQRRIHETRLQKEIESLQAKLQDNQDSGLAQRAAEVSQTQQRLIEAEAALEKRNQELKEEREFWELAHDEAELARQQSMAAQQQELQRLQEASAEQAQQLLQYQQREAAYEEQLRQLRDAHAEQRNEAQHKNTDLLARIEELEASLQEEGARARGAEAQSNALEQDYVETLSKQTLFAAALAESQARSSGLKARLDDEVARARAAEAQANELESDYLEALSRLTLLESALVESQARSFGLVEETARARAAEQQANALEMDYLSILSSEEALLEQNEQLEAQVETLQTGLKYHQNRIESLSAQLTQANEHGTRQRLLGNQLDEELSTLKEKHRELKAKLVRVEQEHRGVSIQLRLERAEKTRISEALAAQTERLAEAQVRIEKGAQRERAFATQTRFLEQDLLRAEAHHRTREAQAEATKRTHAAQLQELQQSAEAKLRATIEELLEDHIRDQSRFERERVEAAEKLRDLNARLLAESAQREQALQERKDAEEAAQQAQTQALELHKKQLAALQQRFDAEREELVSGLELRELELQIALEEANEQSRTALEASVRTHEEFVRTSASELEAKNAALIEAKQQYSELEQAHTALQQESSEATRSLEDSLRRIEALTDERNKLATDVAVASGSLHSLRIELANEAEVYQELLSNAEAEQAALREKLEKESETYRAHLEDAARQHQQALDEAQREAAEKWTAFEQECHLLLAAKEEESVRQREEAQAAVQALEQARTAHQQALSDAEREHSMRLRELEQTLEEARQSHQRELHEQLEEAASDYAQNLETLEQALEQARASHKQELDERLEEATLDYTRRLETMEQMHSRTLFEEREEHLQQVEALREEIMETRRMSQRRVQQARLLAQRLVEMTAPKNAEDDEASNVSR